MKEEKTHHKMNLENRIVLDCPECGSKNLDLLNRKEVEGNLIEIVARCNDCRQIYYFGHSYTIVVPEPEKAKKLKGAKA